MSKKIIVILVIVLVVIGAGAYAYLNKFIILDGEKVQAPTISTVEEKNVPLMSSESIPVKNPEKDIVVDSKSTTKSESDVSSQEKELVQKAFYDFGKLLDSKNTKEIANYIRRTSPAFADNTEKSLTDYPSQEVVDSMKVFLGYGSVLPEDFSYRTVVWEKTADKVITVDIPTSMSWGVQYVEGEKEKVTFTKDDKSDPNSPKYNLVFIKQDGIWYEDFSAFNQYY